MTKIKLLLVEDDPDFRALVKNSLAITGEYNICTAGNGKEGLEAYKKFNPDIIVSDVDMPQMSGLEMVKEIRKQNKVILILMASGLTKGEDLSAGYNADIDNYIKKPYIPAELDLQIKALLKRIDKNEKEPQNKLYQFGSFLFDIANQCLIYEKEKLKLTPHETNILSILHENKNNIVKREDMLNKIWGSNSHFHSRSLDVFITKLRKYLEKDSTVQIETIRGKGLRLNA